MKTKIYNVAFFSICLLVVGISVLVTMNAENSQQKDLVVGVHIKGAVKNPGYYELKYESRVKDALKTAGGELEEADLEKINLAQKLRDGEEVIVPSKEPETVSTEVGQEVTSDVHTDAKVNINTADIVELCSLEGIGEETAGRIIDYRKKNGKFSSVDELKNISGIGNAKFEKIEDSITI